MTMMTAFGPAPSHDLAESMALQRKIGELEAQLSHYQQEAEEAENRFRALADSIPVMIWMSGTDALFTYLNRAWLDFRGRSHTLEEGKGWTEGLHPDDRDLCVETYLKAFTARQAFRLEHRLLGVSGAYCWVETTGVPRFDADGRFAGFMGAAVDVSDRKREFFTPDSESVRMVFSLTERERQVLVLIASGKSTKQAATELGISYKTADSHRSRILEKLGVHETASMVRYAIRAGLIEP
jgi:PAS domain S-box-containing protein